MKNLPDFRIQSSGEISKEFLKNGVATFSDATNFVANLKYGRNANKEELKTVFSDHCGICSTKHALLKTLADENGFTEIKLFLGIFKMNSKNAFKISKTLRKNKLVYIPEAHNYLKFKNEIFDFTKFNSKASDFESDLILEIEILPNQISSYKVEFHKKFLQEWLHQNTEAAFELEALWKIREKYIQDLAG